MEGSSLRCLSCFSSSPHSSKNAPLFSFLWFFSPNSKNPKPQIVDPKLFARTLIRNAMASRSYYTSRTKKPLYNKISPLGNPSLNVVPDLDDWVYNGNKVRVAELQRIIHDLRKRKRFSQALQISEWMNQKGICIFSPVEHAVQLGLIGKVRGFVSAEEYFNILMDEDKNIKTYGALLNCYVRQRQADKSLAHLRKMKEMGFVSSPLTYSDIMCLYTNVGQHEKVPGVLAEMKENNVLRISRLRMGKTNNYGNRKQIIKINNTKNLCAPEAFLLVSSLNLLSLTASVDSTPSEVELLTVTTKVSQLSGKDPSNKSASSSSSIFKPIVAT